jgi:release factor glutamine methyltransferase
MGTVDNLAEPAATRRSASAALPLQRLLAEARAQLGGNGADSRLDSEVLLAYTLRLPRSALIAASEEPIDDAAAACFRALIARRAAGEPVAYLIGEREFWSLGLCVNSEVLIPRPETELVVERALALASQSWPDRRGLVVADLGTGSGAIALALAVSRPDLHITATDRSSPALRVARANAERLNLSRVEFLEGDWFVPLAQRRFDLILSNPPYVAAGDPALRALRYEPRLALSPGTSGLEALSHLIAQAPAHLASGGWLILEHGADQGAAVATALVAAGYARVRCHRDLAGRDRVTEAKWKE